eukprot:11587494-Alexandrium_andersonii.AAC.1
MAVSSERGGLKGFAVDFDRPFAPARTARGFWHPAPPSHDMRRKNVMVSTAPWRSASREPRRPLGRS